MKKTIKRIDPKYSPNKQADLILKKLSQHISPENKRLLEKDDFTLAKKFLSAGNEDSKNTTNSQEIGVIFAIKGLCESAKQHFGRGDIELAIWTLSDAKYYLGALVGLSEIIIAKKLDFSNKTYDRDDRKQKRDFMDWKKKNKNCDPKNVKELRALIESSDKKLTEILKDVKDATLRIWANEAGLEFKRGRPSKK
jgi:hypothetical protein